MILIDYRFAAVVSCFLMTKNFHCRVESAMKFGSAQMIVKLKVHSSPLAYLLLSLSFHLPISPPSPFSSSVILIFFSFLFVNSGITAHHLFECDFFKRMRKPKPKLDAEAYGEARLIIYIHLPFSPFLSLYPSSQYRSCFFVFL